MSCGSLLMGSIINCGTSFLGGNKPVIVLIEKNDYDKAAKIFDSEGKLSNIILPTGATGRMFTGFRDSVNFSYKPKLSESKRMSYIHLVSFSVYDYSQTQKNNLRKAGYGRYVAIVINSQSDANAFEVLGTGSGLELTEDSGRSPKENGGAWKITLQTPETELENAPPFTFFSGSYTSTLDFLNHSIAYIPKVTYFSVTTITTAGGQAQTVNGLNFYGGGNSSAVTKVEWVNQSTGAVVTQIGYNVTSNTAITFNNVPLLSGIYKLRITTLNGTSDESITNLTVN